MKLFNFKYFCYYLQNRIQLFSVREELKLSEVISYSSALNKIMTLHINKTHGLCFFFMYNYVLYFVLCRAGYNADYCVSNCSYGRHAEQVDVIIWLILTWLVAYSAAYCYLTRCIKIAINEIANLCFVNLCIALHQNASYSAGWWSHCDKRASFWNSTQKNWKIKEKEKIWNE